MSIRRRGSGIDCWSAGDGVKAFYSMIGMSKRMLEIISSSSSSTVLEAFTSQFTAKTLK